MIRLSQLVLILILATLASSSKILRCPSNDNNCHCSEFGEVEIQCPKFDPRIFVRIQPNNFLNLECDNTSDTDYNLIPDMKLSEAQMIKIVRCPLLHGKSLANYYKNLNVKKVLWLQIFSAGANNRNNLERSHLSGFEDITRFLLSGAEGEFKNLPSDLFTDLTKVSWVTIRVIGIQLPSDIFTPLENLEFLELGHNKMINLEPGLLRNNKKLQRLNLWGNNLRNLDKNSFKGLDYLQELDLSANGMETIDRDLFAHLKNLTHLNLGANNFKSLPEGLLANNEKLNVFKLLENREIIETLPNAFLANKTKLTEFYIKARLQNIAENAFEGSNGIIKIRLDGNDLVSLPNNLFNDQEKLEFLDLSYNLLTDMPEEIFQNAIAIQELRISNNKLSNIPKYLLRPLQKLKTLHLWNNQLMRLENQLFSNLKALEFLDMHNNMLVFESEAIFEGVIKTVDIASRFQGLVNLEYLNLANNSITSMFEDFTLSKLKTLNMSHNKIDVFAMTDLQSFSQSNMTVDLRYNDIKRVEFRELIDESGIGTLNVLIDHNPINCDCKILHFVKFLRDPKYSSASKVKIHHDNLMCISPERMEERMVSSLQPLELKCLLDDILSNKKPRCPSECNSCEIRPEDKTLILNCHGNVSIDSLPIAKSVYNDNLELFLEAQNLTTMPWSASQSYRQITKLFLRNNAIQHLTELPPNLVEIDLRNNRLEMMNETIFKSLNDSNTLQFMSLSGNPWKCECDQFNFINFAWENRNKIRDYNELKCANGDKFNELIRDDLCSQDNLIIVIASIILGVTSILIGAFLALYYKFQKQIKMWLYSHNLCLWFVTEEELDKDKSYDAFVSYAHQDGEFISDHLVPQLENCAVPYKLCLHERDWQPGLEISTQISTSINDAKRTIVVMSPHYLNSEWARWEFRVAQSHAETEKRSRIIVILYGDIGDINKLNPEIRDYLKLNTYVKWGDNWFWEKLRYAMPHVKGQGPMEKSKGLVKTSIKSSVDDKLELIKPVSVTPPQLTTPPAEKIANPLISKLNAKNAANNTSINGYLNGGGHINGAYVINTSSRQSDV